MATYVLVASRSHYRTRFGKAAPKNFRPGKLYDKATGERMAVPRRRSLARPMLWSDMMEFESPMEEGKLITSRSHRREDMKKHDMVPWEPIDNRPRGYADRAFCKANNLPHSEAAEEWLANKKKEANRKLAEWNSLKGTPQPTGASRAA
jgi:hypothetical protein